MITSETFDINMFGLVGSFAATVTTTSWEEFLATQNEIELSKSQDPVINTHNNTTKYSQSTPHGNTSTHHDKSGYSQNGAHTNTTSGYSEYNQYYTNNGTGHANYSKPGSHEDVWGYTASTGNKNHFVRD